MGRMISGVPNAIVFIAAAGAAYYFFVYESDDAKAKRLSGKGGY